MIAFRVAIHLHLYMLLIFYLLLPQVLFFVYSPYQIVVYADDNNAYHPKQFDWKFYLLNNPDLVDIGILTKEHAVEHYHNIGEIENRWGIPDILPSLIQCERYRKAIERDEVFSKHCLSLKNRIEFSSSNDISQIDMIPTIAITVQIGHYNMEVWKMIVECIENIIHAKTLHSYSKPFYLDDTVTTPIINNFNVDLYISFKSMNDKTSFLELSSSFKQFDHIYTNIVDELGLDFKPFLDQIQTAILTRNYHLLLKLHSKRHKRWFAHSLQCLCGTPSHVLSIINAFREDRNRHMITPQGVVFGPETSKSRLYPILVKKYFQETPLVLAFDQQMTDEMKFMYEAVYNHELPIRDIDFRIAAGSLYWLNFEAIRGLQPDKILQHCNGRFASKYQNDHGIEHVLERYLPSIIKYRGGIIAEIIPAPKVMPLYFPQFHPTPENDKFWGKNFTEWTLLKDFKSNPGEIQKPLDVSEGGLGYYDLTQVEIRKKQAIMARQAGVYGFVYYHYWFLDPVVPNHKVLYRIPELRLIDNEPDLPFMFSWANEPWTRKWSGTNDAKLLINQKYGVESDWIEHFNYLLPFFKHSSYCKITNRPVFIIYRIGQGELVQVLSSMLKLWNKLAVANGFNGLYIMSTSGYFIDIDQDTIPLIRKLKQINAIFHFQPFQRYKKEFTEFHDMNILPDIAQYWGSFTGFNNKPRMQSGFHEDKVSPESFGIHLTKSFASMDVSKWLYICYNYFFITAWVSSSFR
jgi:hypothetical protein